MKQKIIINIILVILISLNLLVIGFTPYGIADWSSNSILYSDYAEAIDTTVYWRTVDNSAFMSGNLVEIAEETARINDKLNEFKLEGFSGCKIVVKDSDKSPGINYYIGYCTICPNNKIYIDGKSGKGGYHAQCIPKQCLGDDTQIKICGDDSKIITHTCENNLWVITNNKCCEAEGKVKYCENDDSIVEFRCEKVNEVLNWDRLNKCPSVGIIDTIADIPEDVNKAIDTTKASFKFKYSYLTIVLLLGALYLNNKIKRR